MKSTFGVSIKSLVKEYYSYTFSFHFKVQAKYLNIKKNYFLTSILSSNTIEKYACLLTIEIFIPV